MNIRSEQEMIDFGTTLGKKFSEGVTDTKGLPQSSQREELREGSVRQDPRRSTIIELIGDVGAGKTTFVRGLAKGLGIKESITSPSFTISKSYAFKDRNNKQKTLIHYDFYRLSDPGLMADDLAEKIKDKNNIIIVEWANTVSGLLPQNRTIVEIKKKDDDTREIEVKDNWNSTFRDISPSSEEGDGRGRAPAELPSGRSRGKGTPGRTPAGSGRGPRKDLSISHYQKSKLTMYLDTSTPETILKLNDKEYHYNFDHDLAEKLLAFIRDKLAENGKTFHDLTEITFMSGPGSFTGLRIGASVVNTLASELNIPLYDHQGNQVKIILPAYGRDANISKPKK